MIFFYQRKNLTNFCPNIELNRIYQKSHNTVTNHNYILCVVRIFIKQTLSRQRKKEDFTLNGVQPSLIGIWSSIYVIKQWLESTYFLDTKNCADPYCLIVALAF